MRSILAMTPDELAQASDCTMAESRRVLACLLSEGNQDLDAMKRPVSKAKRAQLRQGFESTLPQVIETIEDPQDQSLRFLFRLHDGKLVEAVRIPLHKSGRFSVCLSSQVGCAMGCGFCATGRLGLSRNLKAWEMVGCWLQVRAYTQGQVTGAVFMGQGEPFHNYDEVIRACQVLSRPSGCRIPAAGITISTVGLVPQIRRYTSEKHPYRLIVSLSSAQQAQRAELLPIAGKWQLAELFAALKERHALSGERVTLAWVLMGGVNDAPAQVSALMQQLDGLPITLNIIDVNEAREQGYRRSTPTERGLFVDRLAALGVPFVRRYSVGLESNSACGMLASKRS
ncbi:MAG: 23S rRNA (adenine2503-C2)-methyltransferase [Cognaticolwellia sp.]|jgi:23S rRNA (adenine2503-C2)-methyltransferase